MRTTQATRLAQLDATIDFLNQHADRLPTVSRSNARRKLDALAESIRQHACQQEALALGQLGETRTYQMLRNDLIQHHIAPIVAFAKSVLVEEPSLKVHRMPRGNPHPQKLAAEATGLAAAIRPRAATFIDAGLEEDFLEQLEAAADAMVKSHGARTQERAQRKGATVGIRRELAAARTVVRVLGRLVHKEARGDSPLIDSWSFIAEPRRIGGASPDRALTAPRSPKKLAAPDVKLLPSGDVQADPPRPDGAGTLAGFLEPLKEFVHRSRSS